MKHSMLTAIIATILMWSAAPLYAQAPHMADGHPDLSGVWWRGADIGGRNPNATAGKGGDKGKGKGPAQAPPSFAGLYQPSALAKAKTKATGIACLINPSTTALLVNTVISTFIKNTIAHEASHSMALAPKYDSRYGGNHYQTGTNVVMDQSVYYTTGKNPASTKFYLPGVYATADPPAAKLK